MNALKKQYVERAKQHQAADEIVQGMYWENGKGCCVGCLAHASENAHCELEKQTNIPKWLSRVADTLHEGQTKAASKKWPAKFIAAVPEQVFTKEWSELEIDKRIKAPFSIMVLESVLETFDHEKFPKVKSAIDGSIAVWKRDDIGSNECNAAYAAARAAAYAAARAAYAAYAAADAAAYAAAYAADAAAYAAARAAYAAAYAAADAAARAAYAAADAAAYAAKNKYFADQLVKIMQAAGNKPTEGA